MNTHNTSMKTKRKKSKKGPRHGISKRYQHFIVTLVHRAIQTGHYPNASTIAQEIESKRTAVCRAIQYLREEHELDLRFDSVKNGYYYAEEVASFLDAHITEGEIFTLIMGGEALRRC